MRFTAPQLIELTKLKKKYLQELNKTVKTMYTAYGAAIHTANGVEIAIVMYGAVLVFKSGWKAYKRIFNILPSL